MRRKAGVDGLQRFTRARMHREDDPFADCVERLDDAAQPLWVVGVVGAMHGHQGIAARFEL